MLLMHMLGLGISNTFMWETHKKKIYIDQHANHLVVFIKISPFDLAMIFSLST